MENIGIMAENNCILINFPQGAGGHMLGRMLASCDNIAWYDHEQNGEYPWMPYCSPGDDKFSKMHFNKRFKGASEKGADKNRIPPILRTAEQRDITTTSQDIAEWKQRLSPKNFIYTNHELLDDTKKLFNPAKYIVVIPEDIDLLIERWMRSSYYYYFDPARKDYLSGDLYRDKAKEQGITMKQALRNDFEVQLSNYKEYVTDDDIIVNEVNDILDYDYFSAVCKKLELVVNKNNYLKVKELFKNKSHL
jgi:hypothetical protein